MADKTCDLVGPAVPLTCSLNCNFPDRQSERGLQLSCFCMESWSQTDGGGWVAYRRLFSLQSPEEVILD